MNVEKNQKPHSNSSQQKQRSKSRSRSRQKPTQNITQRPQSFLKHFNKNHEKIQHNYKQNTNQQQKIQNQTVQQKEMKDIKKQLLRSFMRIQQLRQQPIDKLVKVVWILKGKFVYDPRIHDIMSDTKKYLQKLSADELNKILPLAQGHKLYQQYEKSPLQEYWANLIGLIKYQLQALNNSREQLQPEYQQRIKQIIKKPLPELIKLQKQTLMIIKTQNFGSNQQYWRQVLSKVKSKRMQLVLNKFYLKFKEQNQDKIIEINQDVEQQVLKQPTSPILVPFSSVNPKLIVEEQKQKQAIKNLSQKIFKLEFERGRERLQINLSLPHNHDLLNAELVTEQTNTYDQITKEIIQFEKYKRMQQDQEDFNDWVPCQTQGRFRQTKPIYINRVRVACEWNKYNSLHYNQKNPPPKTIQGYKFNIFYPDLYDKQKTPQYYLQNTDDPNYCMIKFKAGPPYKDIAFKILKKQWDFTQKSGFQSIFSKGILHLYFNFKKPRFRI